MAVRRCRICHCTDTECSGCIKRTGHPCFWIEPDLCSACRPDIFGEVIVNHKNKLNMTDFFKKLLTEAVGCKRITLIIDPIDGGAVVNIIPETGDKTIKERLQAKTLQGTIEELDNEFFGVVKREPVKEGLTVASPKPKEEDTDEDETEETPLKETAKTKTSSKKAAPSAKAKPEPFMKKLTPSAALAVIVGAEPLTRVDTTKKVWDYIKNNNLQDKKEKRNINCDEILEKVMGKKTVSMFEMAKHLNKNLSPGNDKPAKPASVKPKDKIAISSEVNVGAGELKPQSQYTAQEIKGMLDERQISYGKKDGLQRLYEKLAKAIKLGADAVTTTPTSEEDMHHQADLKQNEVPDTTEEEIATEDLPTNQQATLLLPIIIMALQVSNISRSFVIVKEGKGKSITLEDPNPNMSPEEVLKFYSNQHSELTNAIIESPVVKKDVATYNITTKAGQLG